MKISTLIALSHRRQQTRKQKRSIPRLAWSVALLFSLILTALIVVIVYLSIHLFSDLPSIDELTYLLDDQVGVLHQPTRLYARNGNDILVSLEPPRVERSWLQVTNPDHSSTYLDLETPIARAFLGYYETQSIQKNTNFLFDLFNPNLTSIAQRLANDLLLWREPNTRMKTIRAKILAAQILQRYGSAQTLAWFLNSCKFGPLLYGADTASRVYFSKPANQLNIAQAAALVAISISPSIHPLNAPQIVRKNTGEILKVLLNAHLIRTNEVSQVNLDNLQFKPSIDNLQSPNDPLLAMVEKQASLVMPVNRFELGGIKVITTIDSNLQKNAQCVIQVLFNRTIKGSDSNNQKDCPASLFLPSAAFNTSISDIPLGAEAIILDNENHQTLALVSVQQDSPTEPAFKVVPISAHPAGSILTPFIYLTAFARGHQPASLEWDIPLEDTQGLLGNLDNKYHGPVRARLALTNDLLSAAYQLFEQIGSETILNTTRQMDLSLALPPYSSQKTSQGSFSDYLNSQTSIVDVAQAYSIFANQGLLKGINLDQTVNTPTESFQPIIILSMLDSHGGSLPIQASLEKAIQEKPVISSQLAYLLTNVLADESARWLVFGHPNFFEIGRPVAAKIGRSLNQNQFWSVGYTPQRLVAVWLGSTNDESPQPQLATQTMALWYGLTQYSSQNLPAQGWAMPPGILTLTVCDPSGLLPDQDCPSTVNEDFIQGFEPHQPDNLFLTLPINEQTGRLATVFTPYELVKEKTFMNIPPQAQAWAKSAGIPSPPTEYDVIQSSSNSSSTVKITSPSMFAFVHDKINIMGSADIQGFKYYRLQLGNGLFPRQWIQIGTDVTKAVKEGELGVWDTSGLNGLYTLQLQVVGEENKLQTDLVQLSVDNIPPEITIQYPMDGEIIHKKEHPTITFQLQPFDDIAIQRVEIWLDGEQIFTLLQPPYAFPWAITIGTHRLKVIAFDQAGNQAQTEISFEIKP